MHGQPRQVENLMVDGRWIGLAHHALALQAELQFGVAMEGHPAQSLGSMTKTLTGGFSINAAKNTRSGLSIGSCGLRVEAS